MKMLTVGAALAAGLAMGAPIAASAATARNVVLVPGAFTDKSSWDKVAHLLRNKGFKVTEVDIPLTSLDADVAVTRKTLEAQNGATVLVGHSWGGVVIGEAGDSPKVKALVYVAAFAPDKGESVQALSSSGPPTEGLKEVHPDAQGLSVGRPRCVPACLRRRRAGRARRPPGPEATADQRRRLRRPGYRRRLASEADLLRDFGQRSDGSAAGRGLLRPTYEGHNCDAAVEPRLAGIAPRRGRRAH
jgi:pimeloyl-ACP methyl ester carboxylesterase